MKPRSSANLGIDIAGFAIAAALTGLVYFAGVAPAIQAVQVAQAEAVELTQRKGEADQLEKSMRVTAAKLDELSKTDLSTIKVGSGTLMDRIGRISALAAEAGVSVTDLSPKPEQLGVRFNRTPISITANGPAPAFQSLLKSLHAEFPDTQVASLTISANPEPPEKPAAFSAELVWYTVAKVAGQAEKSGSAANAGGAGPAAQPRR